MAQKQQDKNIRNIVIKNSIIKKVKSKLKFLFIEALVNPPKNLAQGELVALTTQDKKKLGYGFVNPYAEKNFITIISWNKHEINDSIIMNKINQATLLRTKFILRSKELYRIVDSYNDFLPGLVIDKVRDNIIIHILNAGWLKYLNIIQFTLENRFPIQNIYINIPDEIKQQEKIKKDSFMLKGEFNPKNAIFEENGFKFELPLTNYEEIGNFIKFRPIREYFQKNSIDKKVLILYPIKGSGIPYFISGGASQLTVACNRKEILNIEIKSTELNSLPKEKIISNEDPFKFLNNTIEKKEKFDIVLLYSPAFLKKDMNDQEIKRYKGLLQRIFNITAKNGIVMDATPSKFNNINIYKNCILDASNNRNIQIVKSFSVEQYSPYILSSSTLMNYETLIYRVN